MLWDAVILMFIGMGTVFLFLILLNFCMSILAFVLKDYSEEEAKLVSGKTKIRRRQSEAQNEEVENEILTAVISAAVHAYRNRSSSNSSS